MKESIQDSLKKQSIDVVRRMSVLDKHNLIVDPLSSKNKMKLSMMSSTSMLKSGTSISGLSGKNMNQLVRNSIC